MDAIRFGLGLRALRRRRGWTQAELARRVRMSRSVIGRLERGGAGRVTGETIDRIAAELGGRVDLRLLWQGEGLDRLLDARHAALVERTMNLLLPSGWEAAAEVSFNIRGERGSIDVFAFHAGSGAVLVIEAKSVVPDLQAMLVALDRKGRLAGTIAADRGWRARSVSRLLVLPEDRTARRRIAELATTFDAALPAGTVAVKGWLKAPTGAIRGILFLSDDTQTGTRHRVASRRPPS